MDSTTAACPRLPAPPHCEQFLCCFTQQPVKSVFRINATIIRLPVYCFCANYSHCALWFLPRNKQAPCFFSNSSAFCRNASRPNRPAQTTLDKLFVKGSAQLIAQAKRLGRERPYTHITRVKVKSGKRECNVAVGVCVLFCSHAVWRSLRLFR